jgi:hypothetical protein
MENSKRFLTEESFRGFCERLLEKEYDLSPYNLGETSRVFGNADQLEDLVGFQAEQIKNRNWEASSRLLIETEAAKKDFPNVASWYEAILGKAEGIWKSLAG